MKRRSFIKTTGSVLSLPMLMSGLHVHALTTTPLFNAINADSDRVLILVRLNGGNDGLSMLLPYDQYDKLQNVRSNILIPQNLYLDLGGSSNLGLHPSMSGLKFAYDNQRLNIIQNVGYPNQNRSHFRSTDIWTSGSAADEVLTNGWMGRYLDTQFPGYPSGYPTAQNPHPIAIKMDSQVSETCQGASGNFSLAVTDPSSLSPLPLDAQVTPPNNPYGAELGFLYETLEQTNAYGHTIVTASERGSNSILVDYPDTHLANQLKTVARLISGGLQTKVYVVTQGGYDTHANQVQENDPTLGVHANLLETLSEAIKAFQFDLFDQKLEERVLGMTFSEFGRQIQSNFSHGTDHGTAAPLMLFGSCVNAGVTGSNPDIPQNPDSQEGVAMQYDFRDVYGSVLMDWFEVPQATVRTLLYDDFTYFPVANQCNAPLSIDEAEIDSTEESKEERNLTVHPNPVRHAAQISFYTTNESIRLSVFDAVGKEIQVLVKKTLNSGSHQITWNTESLAAGNYYLRLKRRSVVNMKLVIKI